MKVDKGSEKSLPGTPQTSFQGLLAIRHPRGRFTPSAVARAMPRTPQARTLVAARVLERTRREITAGNDRLVAKRVEWRTQKSDAAETRFHERLAHELGESPKVHRTLAPERVLDSAPSGTNAASSGSAQVPNPASNASAALALIERIEVLVHSQRPQVAMTLTSPFAERVEVEKTGPGQVSLRILSKKRRPSTHDLDSIKEGLRTRGIELTNLSLA